MTKNKLYIFLMVICIAFLSAPANAGQAYERTVDLPYCQVVFQAEVDAPGNPSAQPLKVSVKQWNEESIIEQFFAGKEIQSTRYAHPGPKVVDGSINNSDIDILWEDILTTATVWGMFDYTGDAALRHLYLLERNFSALETDAEAFEWMTPDEAIDFVKQKAIALGLEPGEVFVFKKLLDSDLRPLYEMMFEENKVAPSDRRIPPEGYWMRMALNLQGTPCMRMSYESRRTKDTVYASTLNAYVAQSGIVSFYTDDVAYQTIEVQEGSAASISMEAAMEIFLDRYKNLVLDLPATVYRIAYEYVFVPIKGMVYHFEARPAWTFYVESEIRTFDGENVPVYVDAITGKIIG